MPNFPHSVNKEVRNRIAKCIPDHLPAFVFMHIAFIRTVLAVDTVTVDNKQSRSE